jgi:hypothetical protein
MSAACIHLPAIFSPYINAFLVLPVMSIEAVTGDERLDYALYSVSNGFVSVINCDASDEQLVAFGQRVAFLASEGIVSVMYCSHTTFRGPNALMTLVQCGLRIIKFFGVAFIGDGFAALCRLMKNCANIQQLSLQRCTFNLRDAGVGKRECDDDDLINMLTDAIAVTSIKTLCINTTIGIRVNDLTMAAGRNRKIKNFTVRYDGEEHYYQTSEFADSWLDLCNRILHWNTTLSSMAIDRPGARQIIWLNTGNAYAGIGSVITDATPPLGDGYTASGDFDDLPNEMVCEIAMRVWPTRAALEMAHVCQRFRDCVLSNYVVRWRHGPDEEGRWGYGDWRLFFRDLYDEEKE